MSATPVTGMRPAVPLPVCGRLRIRRSTRSRVVGALATGADPSADGPWRRSHVAQIITGDGTTHGLFDPVHHRDRPGRAPTRSALTCRGAPMTGASGLGGGGPG